jgi:hypothetical protein
MNTRKRKAKALNGHQLEIWPVEQPPQGQTLSGEQPPLFEPPPATAAAQPKPPQRETTGGLPAVYGVA